MTDRGLQLALNRLADSIRQLPCGGLERQVRAAFFYLVERLQIGTCPPRRHWDLGEEYNETPLWTVAKGGRETAAVLRYIEDYGYEVCLLENGRVRGSRMFGGRSGQALAFAMNAQQRLEERGWRGTAMLSGRRGLAKAGQLQDALRRAGTTRRKTGHDRGAASRSTRQPRRRAALLN